MSVSGVPSIPGFDVLFPSGNTTSINGAASNTGTSGTGTANSAPATTGSSAAAPASTTQPAGFDVLFPSGTVPGTSATKPPTTASSTPSSSTSTAASQNPYQAAYDNIETWSSSYLMNSVENGAPSSAGIGSLSGGESAGSFAQLNSTLAALKPLIAVEGAEQNPTTTPSTSSGSTGSNVDSLA